MNINSLVQRELRKALDCVSGKLRTSYDHDEARIIIARYTAAFAVHFISWVGMTIPWARHERARFALTDNLRCEQTQDHVGMLLAFTEAAGVIVRLGDYEHVGTVVTQIRESFTKTGHAGLYGTALLACLELTSKDFIPVLEGMGRYLELTIDELNYTGVHGKADAEHARALIEALVAEAGEHEDPAPVIKEAIHHATRLLERIFDLEQ